MPRNRAMPSFLKSTPVSKGEASACRKILGNWIKVHAAIKDLEANDDSLVRLQRLMVVEFERDGGPRIDIIVRLHGRFQRLRHEVERVELGAY